MRLGLAEAVPRRPAAGLYREDAGIVKWEMGQQARQFVVEIVKLGVRLGHHSGGRDCDALGRLGRRADSVHAVANCTVAPKWKWMGFVRRYCQKPANERWREMDEGQGIPSMSRTFFAESPQSRNPVIHNIPQVGSVIWIRNRGSAPLSGRGWGRNRGKRHGDERRTTTDELVTNGGWEPDDWEKCD